MSTLHDNAWPSSLIPDDTVHACVGAADQEIMRWSRYVQNDGSVICIRNKLAEIDVASGITDHEDIYSVGLSAREYVPSFMQFVGIRAAMEKYDELRRPNLVLVTS